MFHDLFILGLSVERFLTGVFYVYVVASCMLVLGMIVVSIQEDRRNCHRPNYQRNLTSASFYVAVFITLPILNVLWIPLIYLTSKRT